MVASPLVAAPVVAARSAMKVTTAPPFLPSRPSPSTPWHPPPSSSQVEAKASGKAPQKQQQIQVEVEKPIGLKLRQAKGASGGLEVVSASGNAAKAGIKAGDTVIFTSSFFGDELWPSDKLGACPASRRQGWHPIVPRHPTSPPPHRLHSVGPGGLPLSCRDRVRQGRQRHRQRQEPVPQGCSQEVRPQADRQAEGPGHPHLHR